MKFLRPFFFSFLVAAAVSLSAADATAPAAVKIPEPARIAYVNSQAFLDETTGIKQLVRAAKNLQTEFTSTESELSLLGEKLRTIAGEINHLQADPKTNAQAIEDKRTEGLKIQQELQQKQQQAQAAFNKRQQEVQGPITAELGKELRAYAKAHDISLMFDISKLGDALIDAKPELNVTDDFAQQFNATHP